MNPKSIALAVVVVAAACGPQKRDGAPVGGDDQTTTVDAPGTSCVPSPEVCNDSQDNDCDGTVDCGDRDCSGIDGCPVCGQVDDPEAAPIVLPDGIGEAGVTCSTDADCATAMEGGIPTPNCIIAHNESHQVIKVCKASYTSTLNFIGFPAGATLTDSTKLLSVCATMEHSYLHDLQMELLSPPDANGVRHKVILNEFVGHIYIEIYLGTPHDDDEPPVPGVGAKYCWTMAAPSQMDPVGEAQTSFPKKLPPGDYKPSTPFNALVGTPLNGAWEMRVTDLFASDNGFLFGWSIAFDPSLVADCNGPIIQ